MKTMAFLNHCRHRLLPMLAALSAQAVLGQGIVYVHAPLSNPNGDTNHFPWDSLGTVVGPNFSIDINGQTILTFSSTVGDGQPTKVVVQPSLTSAVIAIQPNVANNPFDPVAYPIPLTLGQSIGPDAAGYGWLGNIMGGDILTCARESGIIGEPPITVGYFTGIESAYIGLQFQQGGQTYYGWANVGCPVAGINLGWVYSYAYETTPNTPIVAGAGQPAPLAAPQIARPGNLRLKWQSQPGQPYQVQFKDQVDAPYWSNLDLTIIATSTNTLADVPIVGAARFYRVIQVQ